ncbi:DUF805 domain-containing protein [Flavobacterium ustbae]|uniref:DUF805 domain-containing protein n=1 Tax=Flavobacterium ustbae TaxID=2488790 RepID=UPI000F7854FB|nr:DUF805 domain-containing protein [Flavobacterium ustbae]
MLEMFKKVVFENYANFDGRARRKEYWMFVLSFYLIIFCIAFIGGASEAISSTLSGVMTALLGLLYLGLIIPMIAVSVRRVHDTGKNGWFVLIPYYNLYLMVIKGDVGSNAYGPDPKNELEEIDEIGKE